MLAKRLPLITQPPMSSKEGLDAIKFCRSWLGLLGVFVPADYGLGCCPLSNDMRTPQHVTLAWLRACKESHVIRDACVHLTLCALTYENGQ